MLNRSHPRENPLTKDFSKEDSSSAKGTVYEGLDLGKGITTEGLRTLLKVETGTVVDDCSLPPSPSSPTLLDKILPGSPFRGKNHVIVLSLRSSPETETSGGR